MDQGNHEVSNKEVAKGSMKEWFDLSEERRKKIFGQVSALEGLPAGAIEKDWWVSTTLRMIFSLSIADHLVFKGGTSLSKGWNLIERFSEDIDLAIDRSFLGFEGELTKTQVKKLRKTSCAFITSDFNNEIILKINELKIPDLSVTIQDFTDSDTDPLVVELSYKSLTNDSPYLQPRVLIEVGARSLMEPSEERKIQSMVGASLTDQEFADNPVSIPTVLPKRTFLEKAFLLHEEFQKPTDQIRVDRLSRHLYDLDRLMDTQHGKDALADTDLYKSIVSHRQIFNMVRGIDYANHQPNKIDFMPPKEVLKNWEADYNAMKGNMIYGESKNFKALLDRIGELRARFREIGL